MTRPAPGPRARTGDRAGVEPMIERRTHEAPSADELPRDNNGQLEGPWEQAFYFVLREPAQSKSNHRHTAGPDKHWAKLKGFAQRVALSARVARPRGWDAGHPAAPVKDRPRIVAFIYARTLLDVGNLDKSILDAVQMPTGLSPHGAARALAPASVMVSDAQVAWVTEAGERTSERQGVVIAFARLPAQANLPAVTAAGLALATKVLALLG